MPWNSHDFDGPDDDELAAEPMEDDDDSAWRCMDCDSPRHRRCETGTDPA